MLIIMMCMVALLPCTLPEESDYRPTTAIAKAIADERGAGLSRLDTYLEFSKRVEDNREALVALKT